MSRLITLLLGAALGAAAVYVLDSRRRKAGPDAYAGAHHAAPPTSHAAGDANGAVATPTPAPQRLNDPDERTGAHSAETETEIFRDAATDTTIKRVQDPFQAPATTAPAAEPRGGVFERY